MHVLVWGIQGLRVGLVARCSFSVLTGVQNRRVTARVRASCLVKAGLGVNCSPHSVFSAALCSGEDCIDCECTAQFLTGLLRGVWVCRQPERH